MFKSTFYSVFLFALFTVACSAQPQVEETASESAAPEQAPVQTNESATQPAGEQAMAGGGESKQPLMLAANEKSKSKKAAKKPSGPQVSNANVFNRLLKKEDEKNAPPPEDGIHDPANDATHVLQPPKIAYKGLPGTPFGNYVDWVKALDNKLINPRYDRINPKEEPFVMDMDIVRPVKASVPDVVFPHRQHTEWLHCSNCHPKIFKPQRLSNQINMSAILLGEKCGVCHGKVSFPITTKSCKKCHSKPKPKDWKPPLSEATLKNPWR